MFSEYTWMTTIEGRRNLIDIDRGEIRGLTVMLDLGPPLRRQYQAILLM